MKKCSLFLPFLPFIVLVHPQNLQEGIDVDLEYELSKVQTSMYIGLGVQAVIKSLRLKKSFHQLDSYDLNLNITNDCINISGTADFNSKISKNI